MSKRSGRVKEDDDRMNWLDRINWRSRLWMKARRNGEGWSACWDFLFVKACLTNVHNTHSLIQSAKKEKIKSRLDIVKCIIRFRTTTTTTKTIESIRIERSNIIYTYLCLSRRRRSNERRVSLIIFRTTNHYSIHRGENSDLLFFLWKTSGADIVNMSGHILIDLTFIDVTVRQFFFLLLLLLLLLFKRKPLGNGGGAFTGDRPFFFRIEFCWAKISATTLTGETVDHRTVREREKRKLRDTDDKSNANKNQSAEEKNKEIID